MTSVRLTQASSAAAALQALESSVAAAGTPYQPLNHALGSPPSPIPDIPVTAVFMVVFLICAVSNIRLLKGNAKKGHKFLFNGAMFGFSNIRVISTALRIAWAEHPKNIRLGIAAGIFIYAGAFILYVVNIFFTQRIIRAQHPHIGWSKPFSLLIPVAVVLSVGSLVLVIVATIQTFYTLDSTIRRIDHEISLFVSTTFTVLAFVPIPMLLISSILPRTQSVDHFGAGSLKTKYYLVLFTSAISTLGIGFRTEIQFLPAVTILQPAPWYFSKGCFYGFGFVLDAIFLITYLAFRVDLRFYVPSGASGPGSYSGRKEATGERLGTSSSSQDDDKQDLESQKGTDEVHGELDEKSASKESLANGNTLLSHKPDGNCDCTWCNPQLNQEDLLKSMFGKGQGQARVKLPKQDPRRGGWLWWENDR